MSEQPEDRVEKDIHVAAHPEEVWELVSQPGWWINEGEVDDAPRLRVDGDLATLTHPVWGDFAVRTVESVRPEKVVFRWVPAPGGDLDEHASTEVTLTLQAEPGGTRLRVVESGFASLSDDPEQWRALLDDNAEGWGNELRAARDFVTAHRG